MKFFAIYKAISVCIEVLQGFRCILHREMSEKLATRKLRHRYLAIAIFVVAGKGCLADRLCYTLLAIECGSNEFGVGKRTPSFFIFFEFCIFTDIILLEHLHHIRSL